MIRVFIPLLFCGVCAISVFGETRESADQAQAADFFVVDCLLPGQIRQIGRRTTYVSARRPIKTTAQDCRIRNGEYVVSDQASYQSALSVWLQQAKTNDPEAQTTVGEIFERGMGAEPDYEAARLWYRRAADQDYARAQINLGHLFEKGLGVQKDLQAALTWYRLAVGMGAVINLEAVVGVTPVAALLTQESEQELQGLRKRVQQLEENAERLQSALHQSKVLIGHREKTHVAAEQETVRKNNALSARLQIDKLTYLEQISNLNKIAARRSQQLINLTGELDTVKQGLQKATVRVTGSKKIAVQRKMDLELALARMQQGESEVAIQKAKNVELQKELKQLLAAVELRSRAPELNLEPVALRERLMTGPVISLIEPALPKTRGLVKVSIPSRTASRQIIGRVSAAAGLLSVFVNSEPVESNQAGVFSTRLTLAEDQTVVVITAVDNQGKKAELNFELSKLPPRLPVIKTSSRKLVPLHKRVKFGKYYALIIGNSRYQNLPRLNTPLKDVNRLENILQTQYGFETRVVKNATRYETLSALNDLRAKLTSEDNLLVYYAGHGVMDEVNMRGHWLPIDAEADNTANWISNVAITDILNVIAAKQILLIVDSCYSGTLTRSAIAQQRTQLTEAEMVSWMKTMSKKRARVVLTSGGLAPVLDSGGGQHSVFAKSLFEVLEANQGILEGRSLYQGVAARVAYAAQGLAFEQTPQYAPISRAGHEAGDFFLLPK